MQKYCPFCAAQVTYESIAPDKCPKCFKTMKDAFKVPVVTETFAKPLKPRPAQATTAVTTRVKNRPSTFMKPVGALIEPEEVDASAEEVEGQDGDDNGEVEYFNPHEAHARARELAAKIDPSTIHVFDDDGPVKFGQWCTEK